MNKTLNIADAAIVNAFQLKHLKIELDDSEYSVALIDKDGYEIVKGYRTTIKEVIDDLHHGLI